MNADLELGEFACRATIIVVKDLAVDCLLGLDILRTHPTMSRLLKRLKNIRNISENTSSSEIESEVEWEQVTPRVIKDETTSENNTPLTSIFTAHTRECENYLRPSIPIGLAHINLTGDFSNMAGSRGITLPELIKTFEDHWYLDKLSAKNQTTRVPFQEKSRL